MTRTARLLAPLLAAAIIATPAMARQNHRTPARAEAIRNQIEELRHDVNRSDNRDRISEREAAGLRRDIESLRDRFQDYNRNGLSNLEMRNLERSIHNIRGRLHVERRDHDGHRM